MSHRKEILLVVANESGHAFGLRMGRGAHAARLGPDVDLPDAEFVVARVDGGVAEACDPLAALAVDDCADDEAGQEDQTSHDGHDHCARLELEALILAERIALCFGRDAIGR